MMTTETMGWQRGLTFGYVAKNVLRRNNKG
jgi:hypothetical protein